MIKDGLFNPFWNVTRTSPPRCGSNLNSYFFETMNCDGQPIEDKVFLPDNSGNNPTTPEGCEA